MSCPQILTCGNSISFMYQFFFIKKALSFIKEKKKKFIWIVYSVWLWKGEDRGKKEEIYTLLVFPSIINQSNYEQRHFNLCPHDDKSFYLCADTFLPPLSDSSLHYCSSNPQYHHRQRSSSFSESSRNSWSHQFLGQVLEHKYHGL